MEVKKKRRSFRQKRSKFKSGDTVVCTSIGQMNLTIYGVGFDTDEMDYFYVCRNGFSKYYLTQGQLILKKKGSRKARTGPRRGR